MNISKIKQRYNLNEKTANKHKKQMKHASEIQNLKKKTVLCMADRTGPATKAGPRPSYCARMGSWSSSQWLGPPSGPETNPTWAQSSPQSSQPSAAVDLEIDRQHPTQRKPHGIKTPDD
jgi:hypothetical protein